MNIYIYEHGSCWAHPAEAISTATEASDLRFGNTLLHTAAEAVSAPVSAVDGTTETKKIH